jgi:hypothetical protein
LFSVSVDAWYVARGWLHVLERAADQPEAVKLVLNLLINCLRNIPMEQLAEESPLLSLFTARAAQCHAQQDAANHVLFSQVESS